MYTNKCIPTRTLKLLLTSKIEHSRKSDLEISNRLSSIFFFSCVHQHEIRNYCGGGSLKERYRAYALTHAFTAMDSLDTRTTADLVNHKQVP